MGGRVRQRHQHLVLRGVVEGQHRAARHCHLGAPRVQVVTPHRAAAAGLSAKEDGVALRAPAQALLDVQVAAHRAARKACHPVEHGQLAESRVVLAPARGHHRQAAPIGAVARTAKVPGLGLAQAAHASRPEVQLVQTPSVGRRLARRRVVHEGQMPAVGTDIEVLQARFDTGQLEGRALEQVAHPTPGQIQQAQTRHAALRQVAVPVPVQALRRDVTGGLAIGLLPVTPLLRRRAAQLRPPPGHEHEAPAIGGPAESLHPGLEAADPAGLATVGVHHVQLRRAVFLAFLAAPGHKGDAAAVGRPGGLTVAVTAGRQPPRCPAQRGQHPHAGAAAVVVLAVTRDRAHRAGAIRRDGQAREALELPQDIGGQRTGGGSPLHGALPGERFGE